jgi:predicted ArsR family transcriptional regulator
MRSENIPRRQERLILADATERFERLLVNRMFATNDVAAFAELAHIARALWSGTLRGQALTAQQIAHRIGMPRTTVLRKLQYLVKRGYVTQINSTYLISDAVLRTTTPMLDQSIKLIIDTADALRAVQNGRKKVDAYRSKQWSVSLG